MQNADMKLESSTTNGLRIINSLMESWGVRLTWLDCKVSDSSGVPIPTLKAVILIIICYFCHIVGCLSAIDMVEFNPAIGSEEEVTRTAMNTMELINILLGKKSHLTEAPLPPVDENKVDVNNGIVN